MPEKKQIQPLLRAASFIASSYNEADNTIELVAATEAEVLTYNYDYGRVREVLSMSKANVRLDRLNAKAQVLDNHNTYGSVRQAVLGVVESAHIENKQLIVKIRFSSREDLKPFIEDVKNGIYGNVSIQYRIYKAEVTEEDGKLPLYVATDWEPFEVSFVSVPADYEAGARKQEGIATNEVQIITRNSNTNNMKRSSEILKLVRAAGLSIDFAQTLIDDESIDVDKARTMIDAEKLKENGQPGTPAPAPAKPVDGSEATRAAQKEERKRSSEIMNAVRAAGFDIAYAETLINDDKMTVEEARKLIIDKLATEGTQSNSTRANGSIIMGADEKDKRRSVMSTGLALRSGAIKEDKIADKALVCEARHYRSRSLMQIAEDCLVDAGENVRGMDKMELAKRALTSSTSDFPVILENTLHKILLDSYGITADTWRKFCKAGTVSDFRPHPRIRLGSFGRLSKVLENGEYKNLSIPDGEKQTVSADTYGNVINISRKMIINDDLGAFTNLAAAFGRAAARSIEIDVYALLAANPTMEDGKALFHADHGNLVTGAAPTAIVFDGMRVAMAKQKDPSGNDILDLRPEVLLIGIAQGATAKTINDALYDPDTANKLQKPNLARGIFNNIVDTARISGNEYYAFADPNQVPTVEVSFLDGQQEPFLENWMEAGKDGVNWRVRLDYGVNAVDWRGAVKNPGAGS